MPASTAISVRAALLICALGACRDKAEPSPVVDKAREVAKPAHIVAPAPEHADAAMPASDHFAHITAVKDTLLFADVANAQRALSWIQEGKSGARENPASWQPFTARLREIATQPTWQEPTQSVARVAAQLAAECGACHAAHQVQAPILLSKIDAPGEDFKNHMVGHKWALDRMWAGLATPSEALWTEGATLLAGKPTHLKNLSSYQEQGDAAMEFARSTHQLAALALEAVTSDERVDVFARFLSACAGCHGLEGSGFASRATP